MAKKKQEIVTAPVFNVSAEQLDTKLTRSELIDMIIEDVENEINDQIDKIKARMQELENTKLSDEDFSKIRNSIKVKFWNSGPNFNLHLDVDIEDFDSLAPNFNEWKKLSKQMEELLKKKRSFDAKKAKNAIIRSILDRSADGQELLSRMKSTVIQLIAGQKALGS